MLTSFFSVTYNLSILFCFCYRFFPFFSAFVSFFVLYISAMFFLCFAAVVIYLCNFSVSVFVSFFCEGCTASVFSDLSAVSDTAFTFIQFLFYCAGTSFSVPASFYIMLLFPPLLFLYSVFVSASFLQYFV